MKHGGGGQRHRDGRPQRPVLDLQATRDAAAGTTGISGPTISAGSEAPTPVEATPAVSADEPRATQANPGREEAGASFPGDARDPGVPGEGAEAAATAAGSRAFEREDEPERARGPRDEPVG